jgi:hypothetical protein
MVVVNKFSAQMSILRGGNQNFVEKNSILFKK